MKKLIIDLLNELRLNLVFDHVYNNWEESEQTNEHVLPFQFEGKNYTIFLDITSKSTITGRTGDGYNSPREIITSEDYFIKIEVWDEGDNPVQELSLSDYDDLKNIVKKQIL